MTATRNATHFRKYQPAPSSNWRLVPWILLGAFDLYLIGYIVVVAWQIWGPK